MFPDDLFQRNQAFVAHREASPLPHPDAVPLAVVTCFDPRLDSLLRPALGLDDDQGFFLRTPGAFVAPESSALRSLAIAVFMMKVRRIFVLGHSSCRMALFDTNTFIDTFRAREVRREAFGDGDLRTWAGAIANPRQGVLASASAIAAAPFLPDDLEIAAGVLDDTTGKIDVVLRPNEVPAALTSATQNPKTTNSDALEVESVEASELSMSSFIKDVANIKSDEEER